MKKYLLVVLLVAFFGILYYPNLVLAITDEEVQAQVDTLDALKVKSNFIPPTDTEVQTQVNYLNTLKLQAQIAALLAQIQQLQAQMSQQQPQQWCYDFNVNLKIGDKGDDISALTSILVKEGLMYERSSNFSFIFDEQTASAVTGFQQKYADEILKPISLKYGTGFVGKSTRAKLNSLYGCGVIQPEPIPVPVPAQLLTIISPNGGETLIIGNVYDIKYIANTKGTVYIQLFKGDTYIKDITNYSSPYDIIGEKQFTNWKVTGDIVPGNDYRIRIMKPGPSGSSGQNVFDYSDEPFTIVVTGATNLPPTISGVSGPTTLNINQTDTWEIKASDPEQGVLSYQVFWGDEVVGASAQLSKPLTYYSQTATFTHSYSKAGIYYPTFIVTDSPPGFQDAPRPFQQGLSAKTSISVNVGSATITSPVLLISPTNITVGNTYQFIGVVSNATPNTDVKLYLQRPNGTMKYENYYVGRTDANGVLKVVNTQTIPNAYCCTYSAWVEVGGQKSNPVNINITPATQSSITVLSPNGGEKLEVGKTYAITWSSQNISWPYITINLLRKGVFERTLFTSIANDGNENWVIPSDLMLVNDYKINIFCTPISGDSPCSDAIDSSDAPFSIVAAPATVNKPDLSVLDIYNDSGKLSVQIGNIGSSTAPSNTGYLYIWIDDQLKWTYSLSTLSNQSFLLPGGTTVVQPQVLSGLRKIKAHIDPTNFISESNENNNVLEKALTFGSTTSTSTLSFLNISLDSSTPAAGTAIAPGTTNAKLASFKLTAGSNDISINNIQMVRQGGTDTTFQNFKLYDGNVQIGSTIAVSSNIMNFSFLPYIIPANSSKTLTLYADVNIAAAEQNVYFELRSIGAVDNVTANTITPIGTPVYSNTIKTGSSFAGDVVAIKAIDDLESQAGNVIAGTEAVLAKIKFTAIYDNMIINKMRIILSPSTSIDGNWPQVIDEVSVINLYDGATKIGSYYVTASGDYAGTAFIENLGWTISKDSSKILTIKGVVNTIENGADAGATIYASLSTYGFEATGATKFDTSINPTNSPVVGNQKIVVASATVSTPTNITCVDINNATYTGTISTGGGIWPGYNWGYGYGIYREGSLGWLDYNQQNTGNYPLEIHYTGNTNYAITYSAGELKFTCDGAAKTAWLPSVFYPVGGSATVLYGSSISALYVASDGSTYYDKALTQLARGAGTVLINSQQQMASILQSAEKILMEMLNYLSR